MAKLYIHTYIHCLRTTAFVRFLMDFLEDNRIFAKSEMSLE